LPDFRGMAADEDMAIRFYRRGDAEDLADQLITILESPMLERQMAEHNFAAGFEMTMISIVNNYLRWFRVNRSSRAIRRQMSKPERVAESQDFQLDGAPSELHLPPSLVAQRCERSEELITLEPAPGLADAAEYGAEPFPRRSPGSRNGRA
jgi:hypothetical protein